MPIVFNFEGKKLSMPVSWDEVTVEHFINPDFLVGNSLGLISAMSGISMHKLCNTTEDLLPHFEKCVRFLNENPNGWKGDPNVPIKLTVLGKECTIPKNIELSSVGKKIMFGQAMTKNKFIYSSIPEAIAIYLGDQIYDNWYERVDEIAEAVRKLPIGYVYSVADFFLSLSRKSKPSGHLI